MKLAIDFDGVVHDNKHAVEGRKMGPPMPGAVDALQDIYSAGYHIIIHTTMANTPSGRRAVADWLEYYDLDYHEIVAKPGADFYLDDKAIKHHTWPKTLNLIGLQQ